LSQAFLYRKLAEMPEPKRDIFLERGIPINPAASHGKFWVLLVLSRE
jgi:hypothetical protein